jgi:hypothetical protein
MEGANSQTQHRAHISLQLIGIDLAKNVFHLHGVDGSERKVLQKLVY